DPRRPPAAAGRRPARLLRGAAGDRGRGRAGLPPRTPARRLTRPLGASERAVFRFSVDLGLIDPPMSPRSRRAEGAGGGAPPPAPLPPAASGPGRAHPEDGEFGPAGVEPVPGGFEQGGQPAAVRGPGEFRSEEHTS